MILNSYAYGELLKRQAHVLGTLVLTGIAAISANVGAEETCATIRRDNVVTCALTTSPLVRAAAEDIAAAGGRRLAASPWLPSNPMLTISAARRSPTEGRSEALNLYATLSQEIELSGQRASRIRAAEADVAGRTESAVVARRSVAAAAYGAYFHVIAARDALAVAARLEANAQQIAKIARARADAGVAPLLDADVAEAASLRLVQSRLAVERELETSSIALAALLGRDPRSERLAVEGVVEPLQGSDALAATSPTQDVRARPEVRALVHERRSFEEMASAFRRARFPSLTLQVYGQNDGYNERVFGGGLSIPIPLPEPVGKLYSGQIAENRALARRSESRADLAVRELSADLAAAGATFRARRREAELYSPDRVARAEKAMSELGREMEAGRLPPRDAIVLQQQLIDVVRGAVETRRALALASVDLAVAAGVPLESGGR
jgi:outer membrane protein, heavy metal efflux system